MEVSELGVCAAERQVLFGLDLANGSETGLNAPPPKCEVLSWVDCCQLLRLSHRANLTARGGTDRRMVRLNPLSFDPAQAMPPAPRKLTA